MNDVSGNNDGTQDQWSPDELIPFGKYILLDRINSGATAAVYRANVRGEAGFERLVAIKRILPHMAGDRDFVDTFVREAKTVARLTHAGICPIYELGKVGESLYMAIEYIQGRDMGQIMRRLAKRGETMPPVIAAWICARLCDSLDYAHNLKNASGARVGILHRDLSPSNTIVSYEGQVRLIDFGLAKAVGRAQSTNVDALKRKLGYMSPEMVKGKPLDARSDIFGVGVCLYEMVTGRRLFSGQNDIDTLKLVGKALVPPPSAIVDDAPEELEIIVMHALEREPEDRFQSAAIMGETLNAYLHKADPSWNPQRLSEWMHSLFPAEIEHEQRRIKRLLAASADPELIKQRRIFFASPSGAAARARAEIERRLSTEPPPVQAEISPAVPRAGALPKELMPQPAAAAAPARPLPAYQPLPAYRPLPADEEATSFYDPDRTKSGPAPEEKRPAAPFEDEPTDFYDAEKTTHAADPDQVRTKTAPAAAAAAAAAASQGDSFEDEPTQFLVDEEIEVVAPLQPRPVSRPGFDFEEEPTEIFFNKEEGVGIPELLDEINDVEGRGPLNKPIVAPELGMAPVPSAPPPAASWPPPRPRSLTPPPPAANWPPPRAPQSTLELRAMRQRRASSGWPIAAGLVVLALAVAALIVKTPVGVALGVRAAASGAVEVRTLPIVAAEIKLDQVYRGRAPLRMEGVRAGARRLDIRAQGYLPVTREVEVGKDRTALVTITLVPDRPKPAPAPTAPLAPPPGTLAPGSTGPVPGVIPQQLAPQETHSSSRSRRHRSSDTPAQPIPIPIATPEPSAPAAAAPAAAPGSPGTLVINSVPWALVFIDGRDTGRSTPLMGYTIAPGTHEVRLQTATGQVHVERVTVAAGQTVRVMRRF